VKSRFERQIVKTKTAEGFEYWFVTCHCALSPMCDAGGVNLRPDREVVGNRLRAMSIPTR